MLTFTLATLVPWLIAHGYFIFFFTALIEGPLVTTAAGITASLGYFNILLIILVAISGDLVADVVYYFIGYQGRNLILKRYGYRFGITKERIEKMEKMIHTNFKKTMLVIKLSPIIPIPGLIMIGASHAPLRKFIQISLLVTIPRSLLFALLGFYSGKAYIYLADTVIGGTYIIGGLILIVAIVFLAYRKMSLRARKEIDL